MRAATAAGVVALALVAQASLGEGPGAVVAAGSTVGAVQPAGWTAGGMPGAGGGWVGGLTTDARPLAWSTDLSTLLLLVDRVRASPRDDDQLSVASDAASGFSATWSPEAHRAASRSVDVSGLGAHGIPEPALRAYTGAADTLAVLAPSCGVDWALLAGIGRVETNHGRFAGAVIGSSGVSLPAIFGPRLDGSLAGTMVIRDTDGGRLDRDAAYDRAVGPMQFLPGTWGGYSSDGDGDGVSDPHDIDDAALAAAKYLCSAAGGLDQPSGAAKAVRRYNNSAAYVELVLSLGNLFRTGAAVGIPALGGPFLSPVDLGLPALDPPADLLLVVPYVPPPLPAAVDPPLPAPTVTPEPTPSSASAPAPTATVSPRPTATTSPSSSPSPSKPSHTSASTATPEPSLPQCVDPSAEPGVDPSAEPGVDPSVDPGAEASVDPSVDPGVDLGVDPGADPSVDPSAEASVDPGVDPGADPSVDPSAEASVDPGVDPGADPSVDPSAEASAEPSADPSAEASVDPSADPSADPTCSPRPEPSEPEPSDHEPTGPRPTGDRPSPASTASAVPAKSRHGRTTTTRKLHQVVGRPPRSGDANAASVTELSRHAAFVPMHRGHFRRHHHYRGGRP